MKMSFEIHPRIGVARLGNSVDVHDGFYLSPESVGGLPIACDEWGNVDPSSDSKKINFKDAVGAVKRQAAKFRIFKSVDGEAPELISLSDEDIKSIKWSVHIANKKPVWYTFSELQGNLNFGSKNSYEKQHIPLNNPDVKLPEARQKLIIDPGPRSISSPRNKVEFSRYNMPEDYKHGSFPPVESGGQQINSLGELRMDDQGNLIALGAYGKVTGDAVINSFRGAAGYWDDIADGYVIAEVTLSDGSVHVADSAWLIVGSPKYAPEVVNITTLADTIEDVSIRKNNAKPEMFSGEQKDADYWPKDPGNGYTPLLGFNPDYIVNFNRDIAPILKRMSLYKYVANVPTMDEFARPNFDVRDNSDELKNKRMAYFSMFRIPLLPEDYEKYYDTMKAGPSQLFGFENHDLKQPSGIPLMPLNSGDNSVTNEGPIYKFETLSPTQYFCLYQWAMGKFTNKDPESLQLADELDRVDTGNCVGAPFSPGIEVTWSVRSANIYAKPLQFNLAHAPNGNFEMMTLFYKDNGLTASRDECVEGSCEPGDLTKRMAIPWMADFHECTVQTPNITNIHTNQLADGSGIEVPPAFYVYWWPPQSPFNVTTGTLNPQDQILDAFVSDIDGQTVIPAGQNVEYQRGINSPQQMIDSWFMLGFVVNRGNDAIPYFVETERNFGQFAQGHINQIATAAAEASTVAKS